MALKAAPARLSALPNRLGFGAANHDVQRGKRQPWRKWYNTARWQALRLQVLQRDGYVCQHTGVMLVGKRHAPNSPTIHHIRDHKGDAALFWDLNNLEAVSKQWHDTVAQSAEKRRG